jgi:hypothetical protein
MGQHRMKTPQSAGLVESPLPGDGHGGFGERPGETDREQSRHRAPGRLNAEHWIHLRTTNPIESTFSTVKLRTKVTRGAGSPAAALAMVFKLVESAQARWRAITGAHLVPLVRAGARFENGVLIEREEQAA